MKDNNQKVIYRIGEANMSQEAVETLANWQQHDNDNVEGLIVDLLKASSFIARLSEQVGESVREQAMHHIILISGIAEELEVFKK